MDPKLGVLGLGAAAVGAAPFAAYQVYGEGVAMAAVQSVAALSAALWVAGRLSRDWRNGVALGFGTIGAALALVLAGAGAVSYMVAGYANYYVVAYVMSAPFGIPGAALGGALGGYLRHRSRSMASAPSDAADAIQ